MRRIRVASRGLVAGRWMFILAALLLTSSAYAAEVTASLLGTVRDASGAVVTGARTGFRKCVQEGIILQVNQAAKQDISLQVGAQTEVVEVTGDVAQVDTVTA